MKLQCFSSMGHIQYSKEAICFPGRARYNRRWRSRWREMVISAVRERTATGTIVLWNKKRTLPFQHSLNTIHKGERRGVRKSSCHRGRLCQGKHHVQEINVSSHCFEQLFLPTHPSLHTWSSPYCVPLQHTQLSSELFMIGYPFAQLVTIFQLLWWIS